MVSIVITFLMIFTAMFVASAYEKSKTFTIIGLLGVLICLGFGVVIQGNVSVTYIRLFDKQYHQNMISVIEEIERVESVSGLHLNKNMKDKIINNVFVSNKLKEQGR